jgi:amidase
MPNQEICFMSARELAQRIRSRELSAVEVMSAHLAQIERVNAKVNAIVTLTAEQALRDAQAADDQLKRGDAVGALHGLPVGYKDLTETKGIRTTFGSPIYQDYVPTRDTLVVERMKRAGAITVGKTNTPEFGAGSQTFNTVFGATRNPFDLAKTCGGSSGGGAVALACGMTALADGSDLGASLRNPASFCNVVGLRPSMGRVPAWPAKVSWNTLSVPGPMGRSVADVALQMSVMAGFDARAPMSIAESGVKFTGPLARDFKGTRVAWSIDLGGLPFERQVTEVVAAQRQTLADIGCDVEDATPDFTDADEIFKVFRALEFEAKLGRDLDQHRAQMKDTVIWNIEEGRKLSGSQIAAAEVKRTALYQRLLRFMEKYQFLVLPTMQVAPFDIDRTYIDEIDGIKLPTYIDWMKSCYYISVTGHPAISVPCGFTPEGLPIGLQIVGRHHDDFGVLQLAYAFEQTTRYGMRRPAQAT